MGEWPFKIKHSFVHLMGVQLIAYIKLLSLVRTLCCLKLI